MKDYNDTDECERNRQFKFLPLNKLNILKLNEKHSYTYEQPIRIKILLPVNAEGDLELFTLCQVLVVSSFKNPLNSKQTRHYHLHPELVLNPPDTNGNEPVAFVCSDCINNINKQKNPNNSIADGVEFPLGKIIGLTDLSIRELHIISYVRYYYNIIKIESNSRHLREHQPSAIKGFLNKMLHKLYQIYFSLKP